MDCSRFTRTPFSIASPDTRRVWLQRYRIISTSKSALHRQCEIGITELARRGEEVSLDQRIFPKALMVVSGLVTLHISQVDEGLISIYANINSVNYGRCRICRDISFNVFLFDFIDSWFCGRCSIAKRIKNGLLVRSTHSECSVLPLAFMPG